jgi:hypothetical protein
VVVVVVVVVVEEVDLLLRDFYEGAMRLLINLDGGHAGLLLQSLYHICKIFH